MRSRRFPRTWLGIRKPAVAELHGARHEVARHRDELVRNASRRREAEELGGAVHRADEEAAVRRGVQAPGLARSRERGACLCWPSRDTEIACWRSPKLTKARTELPSAPIASGGESGSCGANGVALPVSTSRTIHAARGIFGADEAAPEDDRLSIRKCPQAPVPPFGRHGAARRGSSSPVSGWKRWIWKLRAASRLTTRRLPSGKRLGTLGVLEHRAAPRRREARR